MLLLNYDMYALCRSSGVFTPVCSLISQTLTLTEKGASYITNCVSVAAIIPQEMEIGV